MPPRPDPKSRAQEPQRPEGAKAALRSAVRSEPPPAGKSGNFEKAFPVYLEGERGIVSGIGRNISATGAFVETREVFPLGSRLKVTFTSPSGAEMVLEAEVRYQCFINFGRADASQGGMRGVGLRFLATPTRERERRSRMH